MDFKDYYGREMVDLRRRGNEAAEKNPLLKPFFTTAGADPDIERVFESFAFLTARLVQKLEDELPEILEPLFSLVWPHYLSPLPATSVIQYQVNANVSGLTTIPKGTQVSSSPVEGTKCHFRTVYDVDILPIKPHGVVLENRHGEITLALQLAPTTVNLSSLKIPSLKFFLTGQNGEHLYHALLCLLKEVRVVVRDDQPGSHTVHVFDKSLVQPMGFSAEEGLYSYSGSTQLPYRILFEYFAYPEKFMFLELKDESVPLFDGTNIDNPELLELHFIFSSMPPGYENITVADWKLFCTPIVNLFPVQELPIEVKAEATKIIPSPDKPDHMGVYRVEKVAAWDESEKKFNYLDSNISLGFLPDILSQTRHYRFIFKPTLAGDAQDAFLVFHGLPEGELTRIDLTCTNKSLPGKLGLGDICVVAEDGTTNTQLFANILPVTVPAQAPCSDAILWQLLSDVSPNILSIEDANAFRAVLRNYHFRAFHDARCARDLNRYLSSIVRITKHETDRIYKQGVIRGMQIRIVIDEAQYTRPGELYLFCSILSAFLGRHATRNSFTQCITTLSPSNKQYHWPVTYGQTDM